MNNPAGLGQGVSMVELEAFRTLYFNMLTVCNKKCLTAYGKDLDDYEKKCVDSCVDKFFDAQKEISLVMQNQQLQ
ncbi:hypothetical protein FDP41_013437 [Naegleria fowleri]|uniref:Mitochondrial import inner membrane translocase subunit n=1 Tax=Naegleria fowleri TaxID=5763 RepID=A0A6A5BQB5_NAEFO|nr:uncharacterized protein FDP41_013437 [Naegleria fowleri]KAF0980223.1 hypothetical protein FDP41_013437 [Naegleria fowleri]CAG4709527.1 unnamed protein product [Naegleria fowleri]